MRRYVVALYTWDDSPYVEVFHCQADSEDHAIEQALAEYPGMEVAHAVLDIEAA